MTQWMKEQGRVLYDRMRRKGWVRNEMLLTARLFCMMLSLPFTV